MSNKVLNDVKVEKWLNVLFIFTILCIWIAMFFMWFFQVCPMQGVRVWYGAFICIPIPTLSIVLGIIYKIKGLKCTKNIVAGIVVGIIILFEGVSYIPWDAEVSYKEIYLYEKIIGTDIPKNGKFYKIKWEDSPLLEHTSMLAKFLNKKQSDLFYSNIKNNEHWVLKDQLNFDVDGKLVDTSLFCSSDEKECYYSMYNQDLESYNAIVEENGQNHLLIMMYDPNNNSLDIEQFLY